MTAIMPRMFPSSETRFKANMTRAQGFAFQSKQQNPANAGFSGRIEAGLFDQPRRVSENCAPLSWVQFSWPCETSAQLTRDWVLRTSEVMLISTSVGESVV
jgi:hypothetical protein